MQFSWQCRSSLTVLLINHVGAMSGSMELPRHPWVPRRRRGLWRSAAAQVSGSRMKARAAASPQHRDGRKENPHLAGVPRRRQLMWTGINSRKSLCSSLGKSVGLGEDLRTLGPRPRETTRYLLQAAMRPPQLTTCRIPHGERQSVPPRGRKDNPVSISELHYRPQ